MVKFTTMKKALIDWVHKVSKCVNSVNRTNDQDPKIDEFVTFINTLNFDQHRKIYKIIKLIAGLS